MLHPPTTPVTPDQTRFELVTTGERKQCAWLHDSGAFHQGAPREQRLFLPVAAQESAGCQSAQGKRFCHKWNARV
jgi:hypothetical protein